MTNISEVKGIGPATAVKLAEAGIDTAEALAEFQLNDLTELVGKTTATKIQKNAKVKKVAKKAKKAAKKPAKKAAKKPAKKAAKKPAKKAAKKPAKKAAKKPAKKAAKKPAKKAAKKPAKKAAKKPAKKAAKKPAKKEYDDIYEDGVRQTHMASPISQGIPTKKKRGIQISSKVEKISIKDLKGDADKEDTTWSVKSKELTDEEREAEDKDKKC